MRKARKVINDANFMLLIDFRKVEESETFQATKVSSNFFFKHLKTFATLQRKIFNYLDIQCIDSEGFFLNISTKFLKFTVTPTVKEFLCPFSESLPIKGFILSRAFSVFFKNCLACTKQYYFNGAENSRVCYVEKDFLSKVIFKVILKVRYQQNCVGR